MRELTPKINRSHIQQKYQSYPSAMDSDDENDDSDEPDFTPSSRLRFNNQGGIQTESEFLDEFNSRLVKLEGRLRNSI